MTGEWWACKVCEMTFPSERELERHVSRNWPRCGTMKEADMARNNTYANGKAAVSETNKTWEFGKLKATLTRKSKGANGTEESKVTVINKDGTTREHDSGGGFLWSGPVGEFADFVGSLGVLNAEVQAELYPVKEAPPCRCPVQHAHDCPA